MYGFGHKNFIKKVGQRTSTGSGSGMSSGQGKVKFENGDVFVGNYQLSGSGKITNVGGQVTEGTASWCMRAN